MMLGLIRMDIVRMLKMKSLIVLPMIVIVIVFIEAVSVMLLHERNRQEWAQAIGVDVDDITPDTVAEEDFAYMFETDALRQYGSFINNSVNGLFLAIFTVLFCFADIGSGFVKTISGQVSRRSKLIVSKLVALLVFEVGYFAVSFAAYTIFLNIFIYKVTYADPALFLSAMGVQLVLHFCLMCFCAMLTIVSRSNAIGMIFSMMLALGFFELIAELLDMFVEATFDKAVHIEDYLIVQNIRNAAFEDSLAGRAMLICGIYAVVSIFLSVLSTEKRDVI